MKWLTAVRLRRVLFVSALLQLILGLFLYMASAVSVAALVLQLLITLACGILSYFRDASVRFASVLRRIWCLLLPGLFFVFWLVLSIWGAATTAVYAQQLPIEAWYALSILLLPSLYFVLPLAVVGLRTNQRWDRVLLRILASVTLILSVLYFTQNIFLGPFSIYTTSIFLRVLCCLCGAILCAGAFLPLFFPPASPTDSEEAAAASANNKR